MGIDEAKKAYAAKFGNKRGQRAGLKRTGSESESSVSKVETQVLAHRSRLIVTAVSPSPSIESPRKGPKRPRIEIAESVASNEEYTPGGSTDNGERMMLPTGKLETKKAFEKRMVEQRRMAKEQDKLAKDQEKIVVQQPKSELSRCKPCAMHMASSLLRWVLKACKRKSTIPIGIVG